MAVAPHSCGGCPTRWWGLNMAHCARCHRTFSTVTGFDLHKVNGRCIDPASGKVPQRLDSRGVWVRSEEKELALA